MGQLDIATQRRLYVIQNQVGELDELLVFGDVDPLTIAGAPLAREKFQLHPHHIWPNALALLDRAGDDPGLGQLLDRIVMSPEPEQIAGDGGSAGDYEPGKHEATTSDLVGAPPIMESMEAFLEMLRAQLKKRRLMRSRAREYAEGLLNMRPWTDRWIMPLEGLRTCVIVICALSRGVGNFITVKNGRMAAAEMSILVSILRARDPKFSEYESHVGTYFPELAEMRDPQRYIPVLVLCENLLRNYRGRDERHTLFQALLYAASLGLEHGIELVEKDEEGYDEIHELRLSVLRLVASQEPGWLHGWVSILRHIWPDDDFWDSL